MQTSLGLRADAALPVSVDGLTLEWMREALNRDLGSIEVDEIIWGTATKVLIKAALADGSELSVCVKGGFRPELMAQMGASYQVEARFYGELGARLESGIPGCHFAGVDAVSGQGVVVLDDLRDRDTRFGDPRDALSPDLVATALEGQASWHAAGHEIPDWLPRTPLWQGVIEGLLSDENWALQLDGGKATDLPEPLRLRDRYLAGLRTSWAQDARGVAGIVHGDANVTNLVITDGDRPFFLDWQLTCAAHWAHDVTLFIVGSLAVEDRREHERDLIATYAQARRAGGDDLDDDAAFDAYRRHMLHGLMYAFIPDEMQPVEICAPFVERFAAAITDHGTLDDLLAG
jgi:hypothetical protein